MTTDQQPQATAEDIKRFQDNLDDEIDGIAIYHMLADAEKDPERKGIFLELAEVEVRHADVWRQKLVEAGVAPREHGPSLKIRTMGWLEFSPSIKADSLEPAPRRPKRSRAWNCLA